MLLRFDLSSKPVELFIILLDSGDMLHLFGVMMRLGFRRNSILHILF